MDYVVKESYFIESFIERKARKSYPPADICEIEDAVVVIVELPGINPEDVLIKVYDNLLIVEGTKRQPQYENNGVFICMEREFDSFKRILNIPVSINPSEGTARYSDDVLKIILPKIEDRVHRIKIKRLPEQGLESSASIYIKE